jgi:hypothetical protein
MNEGVRADRRGVDTVLLSVPLSMIYERKCKGRST